jgi:hypothetical protein
MVTITAAIAAAIGQSKAVLICCSRRTPSISPRVPPTICGVT